MPSPRYFREILALARSVHGPGVELDRTGKHLCVLLRHRGRSRKVFTAATPSDSRRGLKNFTTDLRRVSRELKNGTPT